MSTVAVVQMVSGASVKDNLQQLPPLFASAREHGARLLVLPENFVFMGIAEQDKIRIAESLGEGPIQACLQSLAETYGMWVIAGTIPVKASPTHVKASSLVFDDSGVCVARYDKIHLFDVSVSAHETYQESASIEAGCEWAVVDTPVGKIGLSVCYDIRFPELYRMLVSQGAEILVVPSAFTEKTGHAHWEVLLRARAIENLCYVLAPNQGGCHDNGRNTYGHSMIIEPWGQIVASLERGQGLISAKIDLNYLRTLRQTFPCLEHRKI